MSTTAPLPVGRPSIPPPRSSETSAIRRRWTSSPRIASFPWIRRRYRFAPIRTSTKSASGRARARYVAPSIRMTKPPAVGSTSISRRSPSTSRRNLCSPPSTLVSLDASSHPFDGFASVPTVDDQFCNQRVIVRWDDRARRDAAVDPHARADRFAIADDATGRRKEIADWILGIDAAFNRVPVAGQFILRDLEAIPPRDPRLFPHPVPPRHPFPDRMLDLEPGGHLLVRVAGVLQPGHHPARPSIPEAAQSPHRGVDQAGTEASSHRGRRGLLDELLVPAL